MLCLWYFCINVFFSSWLSSSHSQPLFIHVCSSWCLPFKGHFHFLLRLYKQCGLKKQQIDDKIAWGCIDSHFRPNFTLHSQCRASCWVCVWQSALSYSIIRTLSENLPLFKVWQFSLFVQAWPKTFCQWKKIPVLLRRLHTDSWDTITSLISLLFLL